VLETIKPFLPAMAGFLAFFGVLFAVIGAAAPNRMDPVERRLVEATLRGQASLTDIELQAPFRERFVQPLTSQISKVMARLTPAGALENTQKQLLYAGFTGRMQVSDFMGIRGLAIMIGTGLAVAFGLLTNQGTFGFLLFVFFFGGLGYVLPVFWLRGKISERKLQIMRALPDAIDLLTISVEAGLGFDQAMARVVSKSDNALTREFARVLQEMRVGVARRDALKSLVERTGVDALSTFITAIIQAEQLGASVANVLRVQSDDMRTRRRQFAERLAQLAPVKILFPMAFLIFPPVLVVVLGPAIPGIVHTFAPTFPL
jgi:tight adherence protein C